MIPHPLVAYTILRLLVGKLRLSKKKKTATIYFSLEFRDQTNAKPIANTKRKRERSMAKAKYFPEAIVQYSLFTHYFDRNQLINC